MREPNCKKTRQNIDKYCFMKLILNANTCSVRREIVRGLHSISEQATKNNCSGFWQNLLTVGAHSCCSPFDPFPSAEWTMTRARIMEFKGQLLWRNHKYRDRQKQTDRKQAQTQTDHYPYWPWLCIVRWGWVAHTAADSQTQWQSRESLLSAQCS